MMNSDAGLQAGIASPLLNYPDLRRRVQYYGAFTIHCVDALFLDACWARRHGLGKSFCLRCKKPLTDCSQGTRFQ